MYAYLEEFWPDVSGTDFDETPQAVYNRFDDTIFVTPYAATNPDEDAAEVFTEWVLEASPPQGHDVVDQKLRFFDDYPELVELRDQIRSTYCRSWWCEGRD